MTTTFVVTSKEMLQALNLSIDNRFSQKWRGVVTVDDNNRVVEKHMELWDPRKKRWVPYVSKREIK